MYEKEKKIAPAKMAGICSPCKAYITVYRTVFVADMLALCTYQLGWLNSAPICFSKF